jgi:hypothetical protein
MRSEREGGRESRVSDGDATGRRDFPPLSNRREALSPIFRPPGTHLQLVAELGLAVEPLLQDGLLPEDRVLVCLLLLVVVVDDEHWRRTDREGEEGGGGENEPVGENRIELWLFLRLVGKANLSIDGKRRKPMRECGKRKGGLKKSPRLLCCAAVDEAEWKKGVCGPPGAGGGGRAPNPVK